MINTNYAKLVGGYPEYLRLPIELKSPFIINGVTHPQGRTSPPMTTRR